jgi:hypothetical protein
MSPNVEMWEESEDEAIETKQSLEHCAEMLYYVIDRDN